MSSLRFFGGYLNEKRSSLLFHTYVRTKSTLVILKPALLPAICPLEQVGGRMENVCVTIALKKVLTENLSFN